MGGIARLKLLLDTHVWAWGLVEPDRIAARAARELDSERNERWLSPVSVWEMALLLEKGRLRTSSNPEWLRAQLDAAPMREATMTYEVVLEGRDVRLDHRDPADRLLVATARVYELTLVTADERLIRARPCRILSAR